jgi:hypothetical protein
VRWPKITGGRPRAPRARYVGRSTSAGAGVCSAPRETQATDLMHSQSYGGISDSEMQQNQLEVRAFLPDYSFYTDVYSDNPVLWGLSLQVVFYPDSNHRRKSSLVTMEKPQIRPHFDQHDKSTACYVHSLIDPCGSDTGCDPDTE